MRQGCGLMDLPFCLRLLPFQANFHHTKSTLSACSDPTNSNSNSESTTSALCHSWSPCWYIGCHHLINSDSGETPYCSCRIDCACHHSASNQIGPCSIWGCPLRARYALSTANSRCSAAYFRPLFSRDLFRHAPRPPSTQCLPLKGRSPRWHYESVSQLALPTFIDRKRRFL